MASALDNSVASGRTGVVTNTTAYGVLCAGTTATGAIQALAALGAAGTVLTSNGAGALPSFQAVGASAGIVVQVVSTTLTTTFSTNSTSPTDVTGLSLSITPSVNTHKVFVMYNLTASTSSASGDSTYVQMVRNSTAICIGTAAGSRAQVSGTTLRYNASANAMTVSSNSYLDSPATTSATTYKVQVWQDGDGETVYVNQTATDSNSNLYPRGASTITAFEVSA